MPIRYARDDVRRLGVVTVQGPFWGDDLRAILARQRAAQIRSYGMLYDLRRMASEPALKEQLGKAMSEVAVRQPGPLALLATTPHYEQLRAYAALEQSRTPLTIEVFRDRDRAEEWLTAQGERMSRDATILRTLELRPMATADLFQFMYGHSPDSDAHQSLYRCLTRMRRAGLVKKLGMRGASTWALKAYTGPVPPRAVLVRQLIAPQSPPERPVTAHGESTLRRLRDCDCLCHKGARIVHVVPCCDGSQLPVIRSRQ